MALMVAAPSKGGHHKHWAFWEEVIISTKALRQGQAHRQAVTLKATCIPCSTELPSKQGRSGNGALLQELTVKVGFPVPQGAEVWGGKVPLL